MNCIIVDDEPLARQGVKFLLDDYPELTVSGSFNSALSASEFMRSNKVDLIFLDINMPEVNGMEFAKTIPHDTLVIFVTAFSEYAVDSYEVEAVDYLLKPLDKIRFEKAVAKAAAYHALLSKPNGQEITDITNEYVFVRADRRFTKVYFTGIKFVEALKDYIIIHTDSQRLITRMNLKAIQEQLPQSVFARVSKSYIVNTEYITAIDNNSVYIGSHEILIGSIFRDSLFERFINRKILMPNK